MARALAWFGWEATPFDIVLGAEEHDFTNPEVQAKLAEFCEHLDFEFYAPDCSSLSRAREITKPGVKLPPPLRSEFHVRGLPGLSTRDQSRVDKGNVLSDFALQRAQAAVAGGRGVAIEQPGRSYLWMFNSARKLAQTTGWSRNEYHACCWAGARSKYQAIEGNVEELSLVRSQCHHMHSPKSWDIGQSAQE